MSYYYVNNDLSKARNIDNDLDWLVINHLREPVEDEED